MTITGTGFYGATSVKFGTTSATTFRVTSPTKIVAKTKAHAAGTVKISVKTVGGTGTSVSSFTFVGTGPIVTGFTPTSGPTAGGTTVIISGYNLSGATSVKFGSTAAASYVVTGPTRITAKTKPQAAGNYKIKVTTPSGTSTSATFFMFVAPPTVTSFTPASGPT